MKSKLIAIAIGLALILGIVLIGGIRITRANELPNRVLQSRLLRLNQLEVVKLETLSSTLNHNVLTGVQLSGRLVDTHSVHYNVNLGPSVL